MVFEKFEEYWDTESPGNVAKIILTPISNDTTRVTALLTDNGDMIMPVPPQDYERLRLAPDVKLITMPGPRIITLQLNQRRRPEFRDILVRQAIVHAINNEEIAKALMKGEATAAGQQAPKGFDGYQENLAPRYNLKKAKVLLKKAGYADGFECTMIAPNNRYVNDEKIAETVVSMLAGINIKIRLKTMDKATYWDQYDAQQADIQMIGWHPDTEDSANYTELLLMCPNKETGYGQYNSGNYCNPIVDDLILRIQPETDTAKRNEMLKRVERILYDDAAFVPLHWQHLSWASRKNVLIEPVVNIGNYPYFGDLVME
jgi:peptide/nickel transport system substrate-binding protein